MRIPYLGIIFHKWKFLSLFRILLADKMSANSEVGKNDYYCLQVCLQSLKKNDCLQSRKEQWRVKL